LEPVYADKVYWLQVVFAKETANEKDYISISSSQAEQISKRIDCYGLFTCRTI